MSVKYFEKPRNYLLIIDTYENDIWCEKFLPNVIAVDFDEQYYRFYLQDYNPKYIGDNETFICKPDGQIGSLGLPYVFNKEYIKDILLNGKSIL